MSLDGTLGARFASWWVHAITRTAEAGAARDRRAEVASDVYEQLAGAQPGALSTVSRSVLARTLRGMPADLSWRAGLEFRADRLAWHLRNPSTAITALLAVLFPLNMAADAYVSTPGSRPLLGVGVPLWAATYVVAGCILALALLAFCARWRPGWVRGAERFAPRSRVESARRRVTAALGITFAASAVLRFTFLDLASGVLWIAFVLGVAAYLALVLSSILTTLLTLGRYLPKMGV